MLELSNIPLAATDVLASAGVRYSEHHAGALLLRSVPVSVADDRLCFASSSVAFS
jgi:hypothetical protein